MDKKSSPTFEKRVEIVILQKVRFSEREISFKFGPIVRAVCNDANRRLCLDLSLRRPWQSMITRGSFFETILVR